MMRRHPLALSGLWMQVQLSHAHATKQTNPSRRLFW
jgi:hypothetical protein